MTLFVGELVRLTQWQRADISAFTQWFRDTEIQSLIDVDVIVPVTDEAEQEFFEQAVKKSSDAYYFSIRTLDGDRLIGNCSLFSINHKNRSAEFGIVIGDKEYWGKGYGSDAARVILRFAFQEANLNRVCLEAFSYNDRAIRSYEKVGFVHEGVRREAVFRAGKYHNMVLMAVLRENWVAG